MRKLTLLLLLAAGCTFHNTDSTEVGVLTRKIAFFGKSGVQPETYPPGATYTFPAFITDWNVYNVALQNLAMVRSVQKGDRGSRDDVEFKTHDGNDIAVDVTVAWRIDTAKAPWILEHVGPQHRAGRAERDDQRGVLRLGEALPQGGGSAGEAGARARSGRGDRRACDPR